MLGWIYLLLAILTEVAGTISMKFSEGLTRWLPTLLLFLLFGVSLAFETMALKHIDLSVVYAIWSGLGTALIAIIGILWFKEPSTVLKLISIGLIILGVIGLNLTNGAH